MSARNTLVCILLYLPHVLKLTSYLTQAKNIQGFPCCTKSACVLWVLLCAMRTPPSFVCIISGGEYFWICEQFIDFFLFVFSVHKFACMCVPFYSFRNTCDCASSFIKLFRSTATVQSNIGAAVFLVASCNSILSVMNVAHTILE